MSVLKSWIKVAHTRAHPHLPLEKKSIAAPVQTSREQMALLITWQLLS